VELSTVERIMIDGLQAREREIQRDYTAPLQMDYQLVARAIEERLGLETGAIGTRYVIDVTTHSLIEVSAPPAEQLSPIEGEFVEADKPEHPA
jgi:hypothetical protein